MNLATKDIRHNLGRFALTTLIDVVFLMIEMGMDRKPFPEIWFATKPLPVSQDPASTGDDLRAEQRRLVYEWLRGSAPFFFYQGE